tara:strand:- start:12852 stop:13067 length:216 start_codon:yes stop_codon:yes gene_type:complete
MGGLLSILNLGEFQLGRIFFWIYIVGDLATFFYLTFFDGYIYNGWNWIIAIPINFFLAQIWPIYWAVLHWF